ncbi:MAG: ferritin family protein [Pseudomonadota bacterium]
MAELTTLFDEALEFAINNEREAQALYLELSKKMPLSRPKIKEALLVLSQEEENHRQQILQIKNKGPGVFKATPPQTTFPSLQGQQAPQVDSQSSIKEVLLFAIAQEKDARELYKALAQQAEEKDIREIFRTLSLFEQEHQIRLEKIYNQLFSIAELGASQA